MMVDMRQHVLFYLLIRTTHNVNRMHWPGMVAPLRMSSVERPFKKTQSLQADLRPLSPFLHVAVNDDRAERTLEVFPTAEQAARAHDIAALRQYGLPAESRLNHPIGSYLEVTCLLFASHLTVSMSCHGTD